MSNFDLNKKFYTKKSFAKLSNNLEDLQNNNWSAHFFRSTKYKIKIYGENLKVKTNLMRKT